MLRGGEGEGNGKRGATGASLGKESMINLGEAEVGVRSRHVSTLVTEEKKQNAV